MAKNGTLTNQVVNLPYTGTGSLYPTSANGIFDDCGNPRFYIVADRLYNGAGVLRGTFPLKDQYIRTTNIDQIYTENFEAVLSPVPGSTNQYFYFFTNCSNSSGSPLYVSRYNTSTQLLTTSSIASFAAEQLRLALSKPQSGGHRYLYVVDNYNGIVRITVPASGGTPSTLTVLRGSSGSGAGQISPELELSHDGQKLAWAINTASTSKIHFFDLTTNQYSVFEPASGAMKRIAGLEFLPDGRLAVSLLWNPPFGSADGIVVFPANLVGFNTVPGSVAYSDGMLELGVGNLLYANNGSAILSINIPTGVGPTINTSYTITTSSAGLVSPYYSLNTFVTGALPDQIDGSFYNDPSQCPANPPTNKMELTPDTDIKAPHSGSPSIPN